MRQLLSITWPALPVAARFAREEQGCVVVMDTAANHKRGTIPTRITGGS